MSFSDEMQSATKRKDESLKCEICQLQFVNRTYLESHMVIEHEKHIAPSGVQ